MKAQIQEKIDSIIPNYEPTGNVTTTAYIVLIILCIVHVLGWFYIFLGKENAKQN